MFSRTAVRAIVIKFGRFSYVVRITFIDGGTDTPARAFLLKRNAEKFARSVVESDQPVGSIDKVIVADYRREF